MATEASGYPSDPGHGVELDNLVHTRTENPRTNEDQRPDDAEPLGRVAHTPGGRVDRNPLQTWWSNNVSLIITHSLTRDQNHNNDPRDYLALERTFLAHMRTANALVLFGVVLVQLFRLNYVDPKAGLVLGALTAGGGAVVVLAGGHRYFQQQKKLSRGKATAGGAGIWIGGIVIMCISVAVFVVVLAEA
ncbi:MAG: hypothetical protein Q9225_005043 [Loekoesia sp. 1 TL-2023]